MEKRKEMPVGLFNYLVQCGNINWRRKELLSCCVYRFTNLLMNKYIKRLYMNAPLCNYSSFGDILLWINHRWTSTPTSPGVWLWFRSFFAQFLCCDVDQDCFWHISGNTLLICPPGAGYDVSWHWGLTNMTSFLLWPKLLQSYILSPASRL